MKKAFPDGYETLRGGYLGHVHIKDVLVDTPKATLEVRAFGEGQLAPAFRTHCKGTGAGPDMTVWCPSRASITPETVISKRAFAPACLDF